MTNTPVLEPVATPLSISHHPCFICNRSFVYRFHSYDPGLHLTLVDFVCNACLSTFAQRVEEGTANMPNELSTPEAVQWIGISRVQLMRLLKRGAIPHRRAGRRVSIRFTDVLTYLHTQGCES